MPWTQCIGLLRNDFEISQNSIYPKPGAPAKVLANLDFSLVQDSHWQVLSVTAIIVISLM
jgi:hypothetical protein